MLLTRLQKAEKALRDARAGDGSDEDVKESRKSTTSVNVSNDLKIALDKVDKRLAEMKRDIYAAKEECIKSIMDDALAQVQEAREAFIKTELMERKIRDDKVVGWNNKVKECCKVPFGDKTFLLIQTLIAAPDQQFFMVDSSQLTPTTVKYLEAFVEEYSD